MHKLAFTGSCLVLGFLLAGCAHDQVTEKATQGDAAAEYELATRYRTGQGVEMDYQLARGWYEKAAEQGNADAQNSLGIMYHQGQGVPQDYAKAFEWYSKAAEQNQVQALYNVGVMYYFGRGVPQNYRKAIEYYTRAAELGDVDAQASLGEMYMDGRGVPQDYKKAYMWFSLAASGNNPVVPQRETAARMRDDAAAKLKLPDLTDAQKDASALSEKILEQARVRALLSH